MDSEEESTKWVQRGREWDLDNIRKWKGVCIPYECHQLSLSYSDS